MSSIILSTGKRIVAISVNQTITVDPAWYAEAIAAMPHSCNPDNRRRGATDLHGTLLADSFELQTEKETDNVQESS